MIKLGRYSHYKGRVYVVVGMALHTETEEKLVVYYAEDGSTHLVDTFGKRPYFARPYKMFNEIIYFNNHLVKRFEYISVSDEGN